MVLHLIEPNGSNQYFSIREACNENRVIDVSDETDIGKVEVQLKSAQGIAQLLQTSAAKTVSILNGFQGSFIEECSILLGVHLGKSGAVGMSYGRK